MSFDSGLEGLSVKEGPLGWSWGASRFVFGVVLASSLTAVCELMGMRGGGGGRKAGGDFVGDGELFLMGERVMTGTLTGDFSSFCCSGRTTFTTRTVLQPCRTRQLLNLHTVLNFAVLQSWFAFPKAAMYTQHCI